MTRSRRLSLLILCTGFLPIAVDMTIVNVALPSIERDLRFTSEGLAWVTTSTEALDGGFHAARLAAAAIVGSALLVTLATLRPPAGAAVDSHAVPEAA